MVTACFESTLVGWEIELVEVWDGQISLREEVVQSKKSWLNVIDAAPNAPKRNNFAKVPWAKSVCFVSTST